MRSALGDGYVDAVRNTWPEVPDSADFVMYWWHIAAEAVRAGDSKRFGFITTNSIKQIFNRRVVQAHLEAKIPLSLAFAIPDHPWVDAADGAQVRIAMTVGSAEEHPGRLLTLRDEYSSAQEQDEIEVNLQERRGKLFADLKAGADVAGSKQLQANANITSMGVMLAGSGFILQPDVAAKIGLGVIAGLDLHIRDYRNGKDLANRPRGVRVMDFFGLTASEVCERYPTAYQRLLEYVKPERDANKDKGFRESWWLFGRPRPALRTMINGLNRYIATGETAKHRFFQFLDSSVLPDHKIIAFGLADAWLLGILSGRLHCIWAMAAGGQMGVGNDPVYNKSRCFETFPFPDATPEQQAQIRDQAERLDTHRKRQQAQHPELTLTGMYNVLEKIRSGEPLNAKDKSIHEQGLVSLLRELHDELDRAVFAAYGWVDLAEQLVGKPGATTPLPDKPEAQAEAEEELLCRLVALNSERAAEEARGHIRWLRPEYQNPSAAVAPEQSEAELDDTTDFESVPAAAAATGKLTWPKQMREQVAAVRHALSQSPLPANALATQFKRSPKVAVQAVLDALEELGMVQQDADQYRLAS
ncbi:type IIL restriction-modification enzyme MmeI [uncultured Pseudomonas sp.]|uniref:type IIL restriction-modification enzyme MmeI n=1 Tax=uncultured Pseudomonas sp. TaxID=114707 RepID=UPI0030DC6780